MEGANMQPAFDARAAPAICDSRDFFDRRQRQSRASTRMARSKALAMTRT